MMSLGRQAKLFREAFNQEISEGFCPNGFLKEKLFKMQMRLIQEEMLELDEAATLLQYSPNDLRLQEELVKEAADCVFVLYQLAATYGFDLDTALQLVFESNMSKLGPDGKPIYRDDGKVLKGPDYKKPILTNCITLSRRTYDTSGK